jgi:hypothetical protein
MGIWAKDENRKEWEGRCVKWGMDDSVLRRDEGREGIGTRE